MPSVQWDVAVKSDRVTRVWIHKYSGGDVYCPECDGEMIPVRGQIVQHHYRHSADSNCSGESAQHWSKKYQIADSLKEIGTVEVEGEIRGYRADVLFEGKWAFEVVYSNPPSAEKMEALRDNLVVFRFSDERIWSDMDVVFEGRQLGQIVKDIGNSIVKGEDMDLCNNCREVKGGMFSPSRSGQCTDCILADRKRKRGHWLVQGEDAEETRTLLLPNITEGKPVGSFGGRKYVLKRPIIELSSRSFVDGAVENIVKQFDKLVDDAREHNKWALRSPENRQYHLCNLKFMPYEGDGSYHELPISDAIGRHVSSAGFTDSFDRNIGERLFKKWVNYPIEYRAFAWSDCKRSLSENPLNPMLVGLESGKTYDEPSVPFLLTDTTGIEKASRQTALSGRYGELVHAVSAGRDFVTRIYVDIDEEFHPSLYSLMEELEEPPRLLN